ncbi:hypothetical protein [Longirhabdus pacifica]|uniref:hypothetical protein n=1 Tax=Longirhabdus pacifica TaxID=2305227 RepID=UPI001008DB95|nr:hypothetical protein [Longirhabdus pacifica]
MRTTGFIMGVMFGAVATMYMNETKKARMQMMTEVGNGLNTMMHSAKDAMKDMVDGRLEQYFSQQMNHTKLDTSSNSSTNSKSSMHSKSVSSSKGKDGVGLDKVKELVNQDPKVKHEVDKILSESKEQSTSVH